MGRQSEAVLFSTTARFRAVFQVLRESGYDVAPMLAAFDLTEAEVLDPRTRVPRDVVVRVSRAIAETVEDPEAIGVRAGAHFKLTDVGLLGYVVRNSPHVLGALQNFARYSRLMADAAELRVSVKQGRVVLRVGISGARPISAQGIDYALASVLSGVRELGRPIVPLAARLARPLPKNRKPFDAAFGVRVEFGTAHSELVFDQRAALAPAVAHDPQLLAILERHAQLVLGELPGLDSFVEQVRALIAAGLERGEHGSRRIAARLGVSERTLRRKLDEAGVSHRALLDDVRRERALRLIASDRLRVVEVAQRVGFSDPSAFAAAFRRWTGAAPRAARGGKPRRRA
jgi:AraC-like DNA-binding protein